MRWLKAPLEVAPDFPLSRELASFDFTLLAYLDDILFVSYMPKERTRRLVLLLRDIFALFGISLNDAKCEFSPSPVVEFLGYRVHAQGSLELAPRHLDKVHHQAASLLAVASRQKRFVSFRQVRSFCGLGSSCYASTALARLHLRALFDCLRDYQQRYGGSSLFS